MRSQSSLPFSRSRSGGFTAKPLAALEQPASLGLETQPTDAAPPVAKSGRALVVRYKSSGNHALEACAEMLFSRRSFFAAASKDRSLSLDLWHLKHRVSEVRAVFRRPDGTPLASQAKRMRARIPTAAAAPTPDLSHVYRVELSDASSMQSALAELRADPHVDFAQPDFSSQVDFMPGDPLLSSAGSWGQDFADLWGHDRVRVREAWQYSLGEGQVVAVVDSGIDYFHPDLAENVWINPGEDLNSNGRVDPEDENGIDDDGNGFVDDLRGYDFLGFGVEDEEGALGQGDPDPFDEFGHGTHIAGTIAAVAENGIGMAGIAPRARVMAVRGLDENGRGSGSQLWRGVVYAIENGAGVINASWSCSPACPDNPLADEVLALAEAAGVVFVTSAGNRAFDVVRNSPENRTTAITVGSIGTDDQISSFSNRGWLVDVVAPGGDPGVPLTTLVPRRNILSLAASSISEVQQPFVVQEGYYRLAGTSMSAPHVAGGVALLRSLNPELTPREVRRLIRLSARDLGDTGHDPIYGAGSLDLAALLTTELPDLKLSISAPLPGVILDPGDGPIQIGAQASGKDILSYSLSVSRGLETNAFSEIARGTSLPPSSVVPWDASREPVGPRVLRLRVTLSGGRFVDEYSILSLERIQPLRLSSGSFSEGTPEISGRRVVWQAFPNRSEIGEIYLGGFRKWGGPKNNNPIAPSELSQANPKIEGRRVVWIERDDENEDTFLRGCKRATGRSRGCQPETLALDFERLDPIGIGAGRVLWSPRADFLFGVRGCLWKGSRSKNRCRARNVGLFPPASSRRLLDFDGRSLIVATSSTATAVKICTPVLRGEGCVDRPLLVGGAPLFADRVSFDGRLLAFEIASPSGTIFGHCQLDAATAECSDPRLIDRGEATPREPHVSGKRIAWIESRLGEREAIAFCEVDPDSRECNPVRLTGSATPVDHVRIDRHRLVWQDARLGQTQIFGLELPEIRTTQRRVIQEGQVTAHPYRAFPASGELLSLSLVGISGPTPEEWGATIEPRNQSRGAIRFTAQRKTAAASPAVWRLSGRTPSGLGTSRRIEFILEGGKERD